MPKGPGIRLCVDLSRFNDTVMRERHILPSVDQVIAQLADARFFNKLDCYNAFLQCPLAPESRLLTTFITPFRKFCYELIPYGINSAPEHFQKRISALLQGIEGVVCFMDVILIVGRDEPERHSRLHAVLRRLMDVNVTLNGKFEISVPEPKYVEYLVGSDGVKIDTQKLSAIIEMKAPSSVTGMRCFLLSRYDKSTC